MVSKRLVVVISSGTSWKERNTIDTSIDDEIGRKMSFDVFVDEKILTTDITGEHHGNLLN